MQINLDKIDFKILRILQENAKITKITKKNTLSGAPVEISFSVSGEISNIKKGTASKK